MEVFDPAFIQPIEHRPRPKPIEADHNHVPVIDLSAFTDEDSLASLAAKIGEACQKWGFFQVINHGVPLEKLEKVESAAREFFSFPSEEKKKVRRTETNPLGYYEAEHTKNVRDWKEVFDFSATDRNITPISLDDTQPKPLVEQWPHKPSNFREVCKDYAQEVEKLAFKLMGLIALSLGLRHDRFREFFEEHTSFIRLNHYPPCSSPDLALGVGRHKDAGALTVLAQDGVGGLEVKRKVDGEWIRVKPLTNAYIINVGDIIQVWSNDKYESVEHRVVVNNKKDRVSIPYFFNPAHYVIVKPLEELLHDGNPPHYKEYNWGKFFASRKGSNFKKLKAENLQISDFRINFV